MKKLYTMLLLVISLCTASCSDWLDVSPSNQVNGDKLFEIGDGYRNALNGIYLNRELPPCMGKLCHGDLWMQLHNIIKQIMAVILYQRLRLTISLQSFSLRTRM